MEHIVCVKTKDMKRTYKAISAHSTENAEEYSHAFDRTQKGATWEDEVEEKKKSSGCATPLRIRASRGPQQQNNPPPHPRLRQIPSSP